MPNSFKRKKVAVTGGPSGGKTTLIETLSRDLETHVAIVPEAASILYRGGFPRRKNASRLKHAQRAIYFIQKEIEDLIEEENPNKLVICDRGSLDSLAYWPGDASSFFSSVNSNLKDELLRYDWVLHLDTAPSHGYDTENPIRVETFQEAVELNAKTKKAWAAHTKQIIIPNQVDFISKMMTCTKIIRLIDQGASLLEIQRELT
jgi:nicotinamide riboside kinase